MSYDVSIGDKDFNYTFNVSQFFRDHIHVEGNVSGLRGIDGLTGEAALTVLAEAFEEINRTRLRLWDRNVVGEPAFCRTYDAPNGWGSVIGAIVFLARIMAACAANPREIVRVGA